MSIKDVIKNSVYESIAGGTGLSFSEIIIVLLVAFLAGIYIYAVYKNTSKKQFYSKDLNISLAAMPIIVASIMLAMQSNLLVSLGMVGALSIVRFRTAVKNPLDLLYMFWSISVGIIAGVGLYLLAGALCITITILVIVLEMLPSARPNSILIVRGTKEMDSNNLKSIIDSHAKYSKEKSKGIKGEYLESIFEVRTNDEDSLVASVNTISGVTQVNYLSSDGELRV